MQVAKSLLIVVAAVAFAAPGHAASVTYALTQSNALPDDVTWATVTIATVGSDIQFTVATLPQAAYYSPGPNFGLQSFAFNSLVGIGSANLLLPAGWSLSTNKSVGGFGKFDYLLSGSGSSRKDPLVFTLSNVAGDTLASYFDLSTGTAGQGNAAFAAHLAGFVSSKCLNSAGAATASCSSGYIGGGTDWPPTEETTPVPLPAAAWLLLSGLLGLGALGRQKPRHT